MKRDCGERKADFYGTQASKWTKYVGAEKRGRVSDCPCSQAFGNRQWKKCFQVSLHEILTPTPPPYEIFFSTDLHDLKNDQNWSPKGLIQPTGWKFGGQGTATLIKIDKYRKFLNKGALPISNMSPFYTSLQEPLCYYESCFQECSSKNICKRACWISIEDRPK